MWWKIAAALSATAIILVLAWDYRRTVERLAEAERALQLQATREKERAEAEADMRRRAEKVKREIREMLDEAGDCESAVRALRRRMHDGWAD